MLSTPKPSPGPVGTGEPLPGSLPSTPLCPLLDRPQRIVPHGPQVHGEKAAGFLMLLMPRSGFGASPSPGHRYTTACPPSCLRWHSFRVCAAPLTTLSPSLPLSSSDPPPEWDPPHSLYTLAPSSWPSFPPHVLSSSWMSSMAIPYLGPQAPGLLTSDELLNVPWPLISKGDLGLVIAPNLLDICSALLLSDHVPILLGDICTIVTHTFSF